MTESIYLYDLGGDKLGIGILITLLNPKNVSYIDFCTVYEVNLCFLLIFFNELIIVK